MPTPAVVSAMPAPVVKVKASHGPFQPKWHFGGDHWDGDGQLGLLLQGAPQQELQRGNGEHLSFLAGSL